VKGEVTGSESLYIDGKVEGAINLPGNRVTVGRNGQVSANISAREVVVLGKVRGNINASDRVDIRSEGSLTGDVIAQRISIEDGAFFKGGIDIRQAGSGKRRCSGSDDVQCFGKGRCRRPGVGQRYSSAGSPGSRLGLLVGVSATFNSPIPSRYPSRTKRVFVSGHDFSRAVKDSKRIGLQPLLWRVVSETIVGNNPEH